MDRNKQKLNKKKTDKKHTEVDRKKQIQTEMVKCYYKNNE